MITLNALDVLLDPKFRIIEGPASALPLNGCDFSDYVAPRAAAQLAAATWVFECCKSDCDANGTDFPDFEDLDGLAAAYPIAYVDADSDPKLDDIATALLARIFPTDLGERLAWALNCWVSGSFDSDDVFEDLKMIADDLLREAEENALVAEKDELPGTIEVGSGVYSITESESGEILVDDQSTDQYISVDEIARLYYPQDMHSNTIDYRGWGHVSRTGAVEKIVRDFLNAI